jgi:hypothetical protein
MLKHTSKQHKRLRCVHIQTPALHEVAQHFILVCRLRQSCHDANCLLLLVPQQCKARAAIKDAQQESCQMAGALKDSMTKVATGKAIKLELEQLYNQVRHIMYDLTMCCKI